MIGVIMNRANCIRFFVLLGLLFTNQANLAATHPRPGNTDPRIREVIYNPDDIVQLIGYEGYSISFRFAEGEYFIGASSGDVTGIDFGAHANTAWLKPIAQKVRTNIDMQTNMRVYHLDYIALKKLPKNPNTMIYGINFRYPDDDIRKNIRRASYDYLSKQLEDDSSWTNQNYWYCGSDAIKPIEVKDNGVHTKIKFNAYSELPAIYVENDDGSEALVNFSVTPKDGSIRVHRVAKRFVLRQGDLQGCIENRNFSGRGKRVTSGTVSNNVVRETKKPLEKWYGQ